MIFRMVEGVKEETETNSLGKSKKGGESGADNGGSVKMKFPTKPTEQAIHSEDQNEGPERMGRELRMNSSFRPIVKIASATMVKAVLLWKSDMILVSYQT